MYTISKLASQLASQLVSQRASYQLGLLAKQMAHNIWAQHL